MPSRSNPQPGSSKERLANISHFFLSESDKPNILSSPCSFLPVILETETDDHLVYFLARAFYMHRLTVIVLHIDSTLRERDRRASSLYTQNHEPVVVGSKLAEICSNKRLPDLCLLPVCTNKYAVHEEYKKAILIVSERQKNLGYAYAEIKRLLRELPILSIGIVMNHATDSHEAQQLFAKLNGGVRHFLGNRLIYLGHYSGRSSISSRSEDTVALTDVADIVQRALNNNFLAGATPSTIKDMAVIPSPGA